MAKSRDFITKQIKAISKLITQVLFKKEDFEYVVPEEAKQSEIDKLYVSLLEMLDKNNVNEAEDLLFKNVDGLNPMILIIALNFYNKLVVKTDEELEAANFSIEEVEQGFLDLLRMYNIKVDKKQ